MNIISLIFSSLLGVTSTTTSTVKTVDFVDINKYQGQWFEIAAIPQSFQKKCVKNTNANYSIEQSTGYVVVTNTCTEEDGSLRVADGRARIEDTTTNAKLKVTFVKLAGWIFAFGGDYWILDLEKNYQWVVVGNPDTQYGWILARKPTLSLAELKKAHATLKANGYDTCKLLTSVQDGGLQTRTPLCDLVKAPASL
jgi:apolipoprotein D and lipocalin family protein